MIVCHCKSLSDKDIKKCCKSISCKNKLCTVKDIQEESGACSDCKGCAPVIQSLIKESLNEEDS